MPASRPRIHSAEGEVLRAVDSLGFAGTYDFFYLPMKPGAGSNQPGNLRTCRPHNYLAGPSLCYISASTDAKS